MDILLQSFSAAPNLVSGTDCRRNRRKQIKFRRHTPARSNQICHEPFINIEIAFIFAEVANGMEFVEHAPYLRTQSEGVRQRLKNDIAIGRRYPCQRKAAKQSA